MSFGTQVRQAGGTGSQSDQDSGLMFEDSLQHEDPDSCDWLVEAHAAIMASIKHASFNPDGANAASKVKSDSQGRHRGRQQANRELPRQPHKKHVILGKDGALKQLPGSPVPAVALPFSPVAPSTTHGFRFRSPASDSKSKGPGQYGAWDTIVASETHAATQQALPAGSLQGPVEDHAPQLESLCRSPAQPFRPRKQASPAFPTAAGARIEALGLLSLPLSIADIMGGMETQLAVNVSEDLSRCLIGSVSGTDDGMPASFHSSGASSIHQNAGTWGHALLFSRSQQQDGKAAAAYMTADSSGNRKTLDKCNARRSQGPDRRRKASAGAEDNEQPLPTPCNVKALKRNLADEMQVFNKQNFHAKNKASGKRLFHSKENANNQAWLGHFR